MNLPNSLPELDINLESDSKTVYYLQKIIKYDEGYTESFIIGVWDSPEGGIDKAAQNIIRQEKEFCKYNKFVKPHTMTIRKVKAIISSEVVESRSEHYGVDHKFKKLKCANCHGLINYGEDVIIKDTNYFCCGDCLAEYEYATKCLFGDNEYDKLFTE
jgi:hypothetical protein